jgi:hypothetical protein
LDRQRLYFASSAGSQFLDLVQLLLHLTETRLRGAGASRK